MSDSPVTVLIVAYHGADWLPGCLKTLTGASRNRFEVLLVDNSGNGDAVPASSPTFDYRVVRTPKPLGFAEANNFGLQQLGCGRAAVCFLNQDTLSEPGWLDACLRCLDEKQDVGAVAPLLRTYDGSGWDPGFLECVKELSEFNRQAAGPEVQAGFFEVPRLTAAAVVVRGEALRRAGPFDPIFGSYYEDYDLCLRIRRAGYRLGICGDAAVFHYSGSASNTDASRRRRMRQIIRNRVILRCREAGDRRLCELARYVACSLPRNLGRSLLRTPSSQPLLVQLAAQWDLMRQWRRLSSASCDRKAWDDYLATLNWPVGGNRPSSAAISNSVSLCSATDR